MLTPKLTNEIITAAILGFEQQKRQIDTKIGELRGMLPGGTTQTAATPEPTKRKRRKMSAVGRKAIAEAQRKTWAASKVQAEAVAPPTKPKRKLSAAAKAKLVANLKKARAAKAAKAKAATKKAVPARKRTAARKAALQTAPAKAAKRAPVKKAAVKKTAPAPALTVAEAAAQ